MQQPVLPQRGDRIGYVLSGKVMNALVISASVGSNRNTNQKYIEAHREWQASGGKADTQPQPPQEVSLSLAYIDPTLGVVVKLNGITQATDEHNTGWAPLDTEGKDGKFRPDVALLELLRNPDVREFIENPDNHEALAEAMGDKYYTSPSIANDIYAQIEPGLIELSMQVAKMDPKAEIDPVGTIKNAIRLLQTSTEGVDAELQRIADEGARKDREHIPVVGQIGEGKAAIHHKKPDPVATGDAAADPTDPHQQDVGPDWSGAKLPSAEDLDAHAQEIEAAEATTAGAVLQSEEAQ